VRIELPHVGTLSLAEVEVYSGGRNIARLGMASQINDGHGNGAAIAIDGHTNSAPDRPTSTHTEHDVARPWWEVDLGVAHRIERIVVYNRPDCCGERLEGFTLRVLDAERHTVCERTGIAAPQASVAFDLRINADGVAMLVPIAEKAGPGDANVKRGENSRLSIPLVPDQEESDTAAATKPSATGNRLEIIEARWGAGDQWADVKLTMQADICDGRYLAFVNASWLGMDPALGAVKSLIVRYRIADENRTGTFKDWQLVYLAADEPVGAQEPGLVLLEAKYGAGRVWIDVLERLKPLVKENSLAVHVHRLVDVDPVPGRKKLLFVRYAVDGKPAHVGASEGEEVRIDGGAPPSEPRSAVAPFDANQARAHQRKPGPSTLECRSSKQTRSV
jgi:hypothetical protein